MTAFSTLTFAYWVHDWEPFLIRFTDTIGIRYYGLAYVAGFVCAALLLMRYARAGRSPVAAQQVSDLMVAAVLGVVIGGRLGYFLFYQGHTVAENPLTLFKVWEGGMSFHGGLLGVVIALAIWTRRRKLPVLQVGDIVATVTPIGLFFGRIANFINAELVGRPSTVPWAVIFPQSEVPGTPVAAMTPRHPSQLYEATLEGLLLFVWLQFRFWKTDVSRARPGQLVGEFFIGYAVFRIVCEQFREPDASLVLGLTRGTFYSLLLLAAGLGLVFRPRKAA